MINCPNCNTIISDNQLNTETNVAACTACGLIFTPSQKKHSVIFDNPKFDIKNPPFGAWIKYENDNLIVGASARSPIVFGVLPFAVIFLIGSFIGVYQQLLEDAASILFIVFHVVITLFGGGGLLLIGLMKGWGREEVWLTSADFIIFKGIGKWGQKTHFFIEDITNIKKSVKTEVAKKEAETTNYDATALYTIVLEGEGTDVFSFGKWLPEDRRDYIFDALQRILVDIKERKMILNSDFSHHLIQK